jgi:N-methylhydantoinase A
MNAYIAPVVSSYLGALETAFRERGFKGLFLIMTMGGGVRQAASLRDAPIHLLQSGPVGGITASKRLGDMLAQENVIATDVGGTSFDVGLVVDGTLPRATRPRIERHSVAVPVVDLASIGTGGGSIASVDETLGVLRVGPQSAGSTPGPACYGRGGVRPTVTDAAVVLGYLDRLGGSLTLNREAAIAAVKTVAAPLGLSVEAAAEGILRVANAQMADLVRRASIQRGHDPRNFTLYAYGGAAAQYVGRYAADIGAKRIVIPRLAPEFSAWGAVCSGLRSVVEHEIPARRLDAPLEQIVSIMADLERRAFDELRGVGEELNRKSGSTLSVERRVGLRFSKQTHRMDIALTGDALDATSLAGAEAEFRRRYEKIVGRGAASRDSHVELTALIVEVRASVPLPAFVQRGGGAPCAARHRAAKFDGAERSVPVYHWDSFGAGSSVPGPAFVESEQTTAVVYPGQRAVSDATGNLTLEAA